MLYQKFNFILYYFMEESGLCCTMQLEDILNCTKQCCKTCFHYVFGWVLYLINTPEHNQPLTLV